MQKGRDSNAAGQESQRQIKINVRKPVQDITSRSLGMPNPLEGFLKLHL